VLGFRARRFAALAAIDSPDPYAREERAAIMRYDGGLTREAAERAAFQKAVFQPVAGNVGKLGNTVP
jgi:hypothetical protein